MSEGVDYAWHNNANLGALVAAGKHFAMRYISHDLTKSLTLDEKNALNESGLAVGLVFEDEARRALSQTLSPLDAAYARDFATKCGLPDIPIFFAVDFDVTDEQKPIVKNYFDGVSSVLGVARTGVYADYYVIDYLVKNSTAVGWYWQTYAWSGGQVHPAAHLLQYHNSVNIGGIDCDLNRTLSNDDGFLRPYNIRKPAVLLRAEKGYWAWVQWRLGEGDWKNWGSANPAVRPNVDKLIPFSWWAALKKFLAARIKL